MRTANRISKLPPYLFAEVTKKIARKRAEGHDVISLAIGDPDIPTPAHIVEGLCRAARDPVNHRYPESDGLPEFRRAIAEWYETRFGLTFDPDKEVLPLIGSKEGIGHIALCFIDPGDVAIVPDPGYPVYSIGTMFAGGESYFMPLVEENDFLPDLAAIPIGVASRAKLLWINYPNNPTGAVAGLEFFERVAHFAKKWDLVVCHDGPYSEVAYDGYRPVSFLQAAGARDVGIEFHSLSKTYNMTGFRVAMAVGNPVAIDALMRVKSNLDSGIFQAVQQAAITALQGPQDCIAEHNAIYQRRRDRVVEVLTKLGLRVRPPKASLYVWAKVPAGLSSIDFASQVLEATNVFVTPGIGYGSSGEGYVRISLTTPDDRIDEAMRRIAAWADSRPGGRGQ
ncbi:MAG: LL-diaminopimelate aminotransferase [Chloroflexi bacterium]|nr:LL-diaminopimelate aminotransferase [Chloroflexota bacterium]